MRGRLPTFVASVSFVLCCASVALWVRSHRASIWTPPGVPDSVSWMQRGQRQTLRAERGRIGLFRPPTPTTASPSPVSALSNLPTRVISNTAKSDEQISHLLTRLHNDQIKWLQVRGRVRAAPGNLTVPEVIGYPIRDTPASELESAEIRGRSTLNLPTLAAIGLLDVLEDPERFAAAHAMFTSIGGNRLPPTGNALDGEWSRMSFNGLQLDVRPLQLRQVAWRGNSADRNVFRRPPLSGETICEVRLDPSQIPSVRDYWHRIYDMQVRAINFSWITATTALLPTLWLVGRTRTRLRLRAARRSGLCRRCGYDLRATTSGVCPECGSAFKPTRRDEPSPMRPEVSTETPTDRASPCGPSTSRSRRRRRWPAILLILILSAGVIAAELRNRIPTRQHSTPVAETTSPSLEPVEVGEMGQWVRLGDVEVRATAVRFNLLSFGRHDPFGEAARPYLIADVELRNLSGSKIEYVSWSDRFDAARDTTFAWAVDNEGNRYAAARWDFVRMPQNGVGTATLTPRDVTRRENLKRERDEAAAALEKARQHYKDQFHVLAQAQADESLEQMTDRMTHLNAISSKLKAAEQDAFAAEKHLKSLPEQPISGSDVILLNPEPPVNVAWLDLIFPGRNIGQAGSLRIRIPGRALSPGSATPGPLSVERLQTLIGQTNSSDAVRDFTHSLAIPPERVRTPEGTTDLVCAPSGVVIHMDRSSRVSAISLYAGVGSVFRRFGGALPAGLKFDDRRSIIEKRLGAPIDQAAGQWYYYVPLNISIKYTGAAGAPPDPDSTIDMLTFHASVKPDGRRT